MKTFSIFLVTFIVSRGIALKVYNSNNVDLHKNIVSGLHYKNSIEENIVFTNSLTVCIRLKINGLIKGYASTKLLIIQNTKYNFFHLYARYPETWFGFGNSNFGKGFKSWWILKDPLRNSYLLWRLNKWHHICFSYSKQDSRVGFVMVRNQIQILILYLQVAKNMKFEIMHLNIKKPNFLKLCIDKLFGV